MLSVLRAVEAEMETARGTLAERLHAAVPGASPQARRFLLAVKRDCHNRRPVSQHLVSPFWPVLRASAGPEADRLSVLEAELAERTSAFETAFHAERQRQRRALAAHLEDRSFVRGLALSSPALIRAGRRLARTSPDAIGRRDERAETALLRYVTRAATKLSPFSTFTAVAIGSVVDGAGRAPLRVCGRGAAARSLVRANRYVLDQYASLLTLYPPFRSGLQVVVNSSTVETSPGRALFLRPSHWAYDQAQGKWAHVTDALVKLNQQSALAARVAELLRAGTLTYGELTTVLESEAGDRGARAQLDRLLRAGVFLLALPWPVAEPYLEKQMLRHLRALPSDPDLDRLIGLMAELVRLEEGYAASADPARDAGDADRLLGECWHAAARLAGLPDGADWDRVREDDVYEDVLLVPEHGESRGGVFHVAREAVAAVLGSAAPLARFIALFDHRHELHHALDAFARDRWPGRAEVGVLELFDAAQPLWRDFLRFHRASRSGNGWSSSWNPLDLPEVQALAGWRAAVLEGLPSCLVREQGEQHVDGEALDALLDLVPSRYTTLEGGTSLFVQPVAGDGSLWMLNWIKEGTGRFGSRYTPAMDEETRRRYATHVSARGFFPANGEMVTLLDLYCAQGDNLNVHAVQTPAVLTLPGQEAGVPEHRCVHLAGLRVRFAGVGGKPTLRGGGGERYQAVHLGVTHENGLPTLIKFLLAFGPSEMSAPFPPPWVRSEGDGTVSARTRLGSLVLHRRSWTFPVGPLAEEIAPLDDASAFAAIHRWRAVRGLPDRVFVPEAKVHPLGLRTVKPQYLDFTSPLFVPLFRALLAGAGGSLTLIEMLPAPEAFPSDGAGERRAMELLLDSTTLRPAHRPVPLKRVRVSRSRGEPTTIGG